MSQSEVDMTQVFQRMRQAVDQLSQAWATAARSIADSMPEPVKAEKPDRFEHTDGDGDQAVVGEHHLSGWLRMEVNSSVAHLSPDAVNRLAQYLDQYRTDQPNPFVHTGYTSGAPEPLRHWCGRHSDHPGHEYTREEGTRSVRCLGVSNGVHGS